MQLYRKPKIFCCNFIACLEFTLNFESLEKKKKKKMSLIASLFLKLLTPKDVVT